MSKRGLFITVEGGEGVGKSTNMAFLESLLRDSGIDLLVTREPGGTRLGEDLRELLLQVREELVSPSAELLLIFGRNISRSVSSPPWPRGTGCCVTALPMPPTPTRAAGGGLKPPR